MINTLILRCACTLVCEKLFQVMISPQKKWFSMVMDTLYTSGAPCKAGGIPDNLCICPANESSKLETVVQLVPSDNFSCYNIYDVLDL